MQLTQKLKGLATISTVGMFSVENYF